MLEALGTLRSSGMNSIKLVLEGVVVCAVVVSVAALVESGTGAGGVEGIRGSGPGIKVEMGGIGKIEEEESGTASGEEGAGVLSGSGTPGAVSGMVVGVGEGAGEVEGEDSGEHGVGAGSVACKVGNREEEEEAEEEEEEEEE